ncbi:hypothetical protein B7R22_09045 [Subtercola boreus]|uniref:DUF418 domain-containing protein n=1 Tax=Subtercola boreus TaxID=120213 RepID=A0A3E0W1B4_9MICO|nr:hypothetical protein B7R22_09045 [Subtercola boreus]
MLGCGLVVGVAGQLVGKYAVTPETFTAELALHISAVGVAASLVGGLCLVSTNRIVRGILYPLASVGMMPLTIYTGHVLVLSFRYWLDPGQPVKNQLAWPVLTLASLAFATLWRPLFDQGLLERVVRALDGGRKKQDVRPTGIEPMTSTV